MADLVIYETGNGGDVVLKGNDFDLTEGLTNMPYLGWFGGNPGASTIGNEIDTEQRLDWWGNSLIFNNNKNIQFNSLLEDALNNTALDSEGRIIIEEIAKQDLKFLNTFAEVEVDASILSDNRISINVKLTEPDNLQEKEFQFIWDETKKELIETLTL